MKGILPLHLALAMLAGILIAEPANAGGMPSPPSVAPPPPPPTVRPPSVVIPNIEAGKDAITRARDWAQGKDVPAKIRARYPNATAEQVNAGTKKVIAKRREKAADDRQALMESKKRYDDFVKRREKASDHLEASVQNALDAAVLLRIMHFKNQGYTAGDYYDQIMLNDAPAPSQNYLITGE
jgi:hypothetical protein